MWLAVPENGIWIQDSKYLIECYEGIYKQSSVGKYCKG